MKKSLALYIFTCVISFNVSAQKPVIRHARGLISKSGKNEVRFEKVNRLGHDEAFRVVQKNNGTTVEYQSPAGAIYGAQAVIEGDYKEDRVGKPGGHLIFSTSDFLEKGTPVENVKAMIKTAKEAGR